MCGLNGYLRLVCAGSARGCAAWLVIDIAPNVDVYELDRAVPEDRRGRCLLRMNGWHLEYGHWLCPAHPIPSHSSGCDQSVNTRTPG